MPVSSWFEDFGEQTGAAKPSCSLPESPIDQFDSSSARREGWNEGYLAASRAIGRNSTSTSDSMVSEFLTKAQAYDQRLDHLVEENAAAIVGWIAGAMIAVFPSLSSSIIKGRTHPASRLISEALRAVTGVVVIDQDTTITCDTVEDAWYHIARQLEDHPLSEISLSWQAGSARVDAASYWKTIFELILKQLETDNV